jgi:hypothetical protein
MSDGQDDRWARWVMRGRLALALVSARAETCRQKTCARKGHCQARFGKRGDNFHTKLGACPIMDEVEWRAVSFGMQGANKLLEPFFRALDDAAAEASPKLSWEERQRRYWSPEAVRAREAAERRRLAHPGWPIWELVWNEARGEEGLVLPRNLAAMENKLVAFMAEEGCRCARERRMRAECFDGCAKAISAEEAQEGVGIVD